MIGSATRGRGAGLLAGIGVVASATFAHVRVGGTLPATTAVPVMVAVVGAALVFAPRVRWTFARLIVASIAAQIVLHVAFGVAGSSSTGAPSHPHHDHVAMHAAGGPGVDMWILHLGMAIALAVAARWGGRWLRSMPGLVGALLVPARSVLPIPLVRQSAFVSVTRSRGRDVEVAWDSRGPPAVA